MKAAQSRHADGGAGHRPRLLRVLHGAAASQVRIQCNLTGAMALQTFGETASDASHDLYELPLCLPFLQMGQ